MKIRVQLFAIARELAGEDWIELDLPAGCTVADLRPAITERIPALVPLIGMMAIALDTRFAEEATEITLNSDIALIPPVSGG